MRPDEERARTLRSRVASWREEGLIDRERQRALLERLATPPWRSNGLLASIVFFVLTAIGIVAIAAFFNEIKISEAVAGVLAIALAEMLIRKKHWWGTGVESALWLGGLFACIFALPGDGKPEALLLFAAATIIAGVRVRNPLFGALAAIFLVVYLGAKQWEMAAVAAGVVVSLIALEALRREWRRPSTEWLCIALVLTMPLTAYLVGFDQSSWPAHHASTLAIAVYSVLALLFLTAGIRLRHHAPFIASAICAVILANETHDLFDYPAEAKLAIAGAVLLAVAWAISRALRDRTTGFVLTSSKLTGADDLLEIGATLVTAPAANQPAPAEGRVQGDGGFGGAGATGDY
jgi:membrane protein YdbS with pleckstrin-like domain